MDIETFVLSDVAGERYLVRGEHWMPILSEFWPLYTPMILKFGMRNDAELAQKRLLQKGIQTKVVHLTGRFEECEEVKDAIRYAQSR